jgi:hypothetical protein
MDIVEIVKGWSDILRDSEVMERHRNDGKRKQAVRMR